MSQELIVLQKEQAGSSERCFTGDVSARGVVAGKHAKVSIDLNSSFSCKNAARG
jgi:hypothetical protein